MIYKTRSALLRAAADSIEMQESAGIVPVCKYNDIKINISGAAFMTTVDHEFPRAVVEGKPCFIGDELYCLSDGEKIIVKNSHEPINESWSKAVSWNPPKPKTVMVEMLEEDIKFWASYSPTAAEYFGCSEKYRDTSMRFYDTCRKALEEMRND